MLRWGRFPHFRYGWVRPPENRSEVLATSSSPKHNRYRLESSRDLPAEVLWNARKKFWWHLWNLNLLEL